MSLTAPSAVLTGSTIASSFDQLLFLDAASGLTEATLKVISTEVGKSALQISDEHVLIKGVDTSNAAVFAVQQTGGGNLITIAADTPAVTVGVDDAGADVRFYSATTNEGLHYDASEDELGLLLTTKLKFWDIGGGEEIYASGNGHLEIKAGTTLDITAPTVDINAATKCNIDGALDVVQTVTTSASTPKTIFLDSNTSGVAAQDSTAMHIDFDRTVAGSGTAAHNDIGINLDVNSASLGTSTLVGMDIDVVGATSGTSTSTGLNIAVSGADANYALITSGGNVGIGTGTPAKLLHVSGSGSNVAQFQSTGAEASIQCINDARTWSTGVRDIGSTANAWFIYDNGAAADRLVIDTSGNVGIGTGAPAALLEIVSTDETANDIDFISIYRNSDSPAVDDKVGSIVWYAGNDVSPPEKTVMARIQPRIQSITNGGEKCNLYLIAMNSSETTAAYWDDGTRMRTGQIRPFADNTHDLGQSGLAWKDLYYDGSVNPSDERLKENIEDLSLGLGFINSLRPVSFKKKDRAESVRIDEGTGNEIIVPALVHKRTHTGLIAQEIKSTMDDLGIDSNDFAGYKDSLVNDPDGVDKKMLDYREFMAPMMKAIQELSAKVTALENA